MVGIVVVSHSREIASGTVALAGQMAGPDVRIEAAVGRAARAVLAGQENGHVRLVDAPLVEGAVAAAVTASAGLALDDVEQAAKGTSGAAKL